MGFVGTPLHNIAVECRICGRGIKSANFPQRKVKKSVCDECSTASIESWSTNHAIVREGMGKKEMELLKELSLIDKELTAKKEEISDCKKNIIIHEDVLNNARQALISILERRAYKVKAIAINKNRQAMAAFLNVGLFSFKPKEPDEQDNHKPS